MSKRKRLVASDGDARPDTTEGSVRPIAKGASVRPDVSLPIGRNSLLAALPAADLSLLTTHMKDMVLQQGTVL